MHDLTQIEKEALLGFLGTDSGRGDLTSPLFQGSVGTASLICEDSCTISGLEAAEFLFSLTGCKVRFGKGIGPGTSVEAPREVARVEGPVPGLLRAERVVLNALSRMSSIATAAANASRTAKEASSGCRVAGTRKTTPGFGPFEKRALRDGGALPHRSDLASLAMLKDNHLMALGGGKKAIYQGVSGLRTIYGPYTPIEVEVSTASDALSALEAGADIIMFDNMPPTLVKKASGLLRARSKQMGREISLEASGGITLENIHLYAPHVDVISMGALTYSAPHVGFKMDLIKVSRSRQKQ